MTEAWCEEGPYGAVIVHVKDQAIEITSNVPLLAESPLADRVWIAVQENEKVIRRAKAAEQAAE